MSKFNDYYIINSTVQHDPQLIVTTFYYWERRRLFGWNWTPKWGRKSNHAKTVSECSDKTTTIDITIEKNNK